MVQSLREAYQEPSGTKAAIRLALNSPAGLRVSWIVVEGEEDVAVYSKFMQPENTVVKTSDGSDGRRGYANVELIVTEIKAEVPLAHIFGIRDTDYSKYDERYICPENIFLTDRRDLEMMLLETDSVQQALIEWNPNYEEALNKSVPVCRYFGYLRICNGVLNLNCDFRDHLRITRFWDFDRHALREDWKESSERSFIVLSNGGCSNTTVNDFIDEKALEQEDYYDVCRGHDVLPLLALVLIKKEFSATAIMQKMIEVYSLEDFRQTHLYANIAQWQENEGVEVLLP